MSALIAYSNLADEAVLTGESEPGYPLANLQERQLAKVARVPPPDRTPGRITADLGAGGQVVRLVALLAVNANFGQPNTTIIERSSNGSTWTPVPVEWAIDLPPTLGTNRQALEVAPALFCVIPGGVQARYWRITPGWDTPPGQAFSEIGRLWISDAIILPDGVDANWSLGAQDEGRLDISAGLQAYEEPRPRARVLDLSITGIKSDIAFGFAEDATSAPGAPSLQGLAQEAGATGEVIILPRLASNLWMRRTGVYGHLTEPCRIRHLAGPNYATDLRIIEER